MSFAGIVWKHDIDKAIAAAVEQSAETRRKNGHDGASWRNELDDLTRRLTGLPSTEQAEADLAGVEASIEASVKEHESKIAEGMKALETPFLSPGEKTLIRQRAQAVEEQLADFQRNMRVPLAQAKALVETAREWNPKRERWHELRERAKKIDSTLRQV